ncbi:MAG: DUF3617 domain-containing protein, partial [Actinobacteria bacterium]|nr:DUF3617 domain-containing protein [Actinomycetota bacterium]
TVALLAHRDYAPHLENGARMMNAEGLDYKYFEHDTHPMWFSYSFNPSIARLDVWKEKGPFARHETEEKLSLALKKEGRRIALLWPPVGHHNKDCKMENMKTDGNSFSGEMICTGEVTGKGRMQVVYDTPEHYSGEMTMQGTAHGRPMNMHQTFEGKWAGATCKGVKN